MSAPVDLAQVFAAVARTGLVPRGAFRLEESERTGALAGIRTIVLAGMAGRDGWGAFAASPEAGDGRDDPLDRWSRRLIGRLAREFGAKALFPFGGPPFWPFQQWARRAEPVHPSPIGLLIHPRYGLWHSYRGALGLSRSARLPRAGGGAKPMRILLRALVLENLPRRRVLRPPAMTSPPASGHLNSAAGADCMGAGCRARRACPVGAEHAYGPEQASFTMRAFLRGQDGA